MMKRIEVLGSAGDTKIEWDPNDEESIANARTEFEAIRTGRGMAIMRVNEDGSTEPATEFDPTEGRYVAIPQLVGG